MTTETITVDDTVIAHLPRQYLVCTLGKTSIYFTINDGRYLLLAITAGKSDAILCTYDNEREWHHEMHVLERAANNNSGDGPPDMGVTANLPPSPPSRPASHSHALPIPAAVPSRLQ